MSSIIIAGALILIIVFISLMLVSINNKHRKKEANQLLDRFNELAERNNLSFTHKEIMENFIIGLDEAHKKLLVSIKPGTKYNSFVIDLDQIKSCSKKKIYKTINMGTIKKQKLETLVDKIVLEFDYTAIKEPAQIPFYEAGSDQLFDMDERVQKAGSWEIILNKTINTKLRSTA